MSKQKKALYASVIVLGVVVLGLAAGVFAKYISTMQKTATASVAQWKFRTNNESTTLSCDPATTYNPNTLVNGKIAPGTSGTCSIDLSNAGGEVGVYYEIAVAAGDTTPTNLVLKNGSTVLGATDTITGTLTPNEEKTVSINWEWPYNTTGGDANDTADGEDADSAMGITFTITGTQVQPTAQ